MVSIKLCFSLFFCRFNDKMEIFSFVSDDKEEIMVQELISTAAARGCVEKWLVQVRNLYLSLLIPLVSIFHLSSRAIVSIHSFCQCRLFDAFQFNWSNIQFNFNEYIPSEK